jgi:hypothetical protein
MKSTSNRPIAGRQSLISAEASPFQSSVETTCRPNDASDEYINFYNTHIRRIRSQLEQRQDINPRPSQSRVIRNDHATIQGHEVRCGLVSNSFFEAIDRRQERAALIKKIRQIRAKTLQSTICNNSDPNLCSNKTQVPIPDHKDSLPLGIKPMFESQRRQSAASERQRADTFLVELAKTKSELLAVKSKLEFHQRTKHVCVERVPAMGVDIGQILSRVSPTLVPLIPDFSTIQKGNDWTDATQYPRYLHRPKPRTVSPYSLSDQSTSQYSTTSATETRMDNSDETLSQLIQIMNSLPNRSNLVLKLELRRGKAAWSIQAARVEQDDNDSRDSEEIVPIDEDSSVYSF